MFTQFFLNCVYCVMVHGTPCVLNVSNNESLSCKKAEKSQFILAVLLFSLTTLFTQTSPQFYLFSHREERKAS